MDKVTVNEKNCCTYEKEGVVKIKSDSYEETRP